MKLMVNLEVLVVEPVVQAQVEILQVDQQLVVKETQVEMFVNQEEPQVEVEQVL
tara:strand:+ start:43 stop:204 length:162 start_codon:yes stop_codon:yes gene_type:complete